MSHQQAVLCRKHPSERCTLQGRTSQPQHAIDHLLLLSRFQHLIQHLLQLQQNFHVCPALDLVSNQLNPGLASQLTQTSEPNNTTDHLRLVRRI